MGIEARLARIAAAGSPAQVARADRARASPMRVRGRVEASKGAFGRHSVADMHMRRERRRTEQSSKSSLTGRVLTGRSATRCHPPRRPLPATLPLTAAAARLLAARDRPFRPPWLSAHPARLACRLRAASRVASHAASRAACLRRDTAAHAAAQRRRLTLRRCHRHHRGACTSLRANRRCKSAGHLRGSKCEVHGSTAVSHYL